MELTILEKIQQMVSQLEMPIANLTRQPSDMPGSFKPWESGLSPSALYNCSLSCRKRMKIKTPEVKLVSIHRWMTTSPMGIILPTGVYISVKRKEEFVAYPVPKFEKKEYVLVMFPYGNVWSVRGKDIPIDESWLWSEQEGAFIFEELLLRDAKNPLIGYFENCYKYMIENPDQINIHKKRQRKQT